MNQAINRPIAVIDSIVERSELFGPIYLHCYGYYLPVDRMLIN